MRRLSHWIEDRQFAIMGLFVLCVIALVGLFIAATLPSTQDLQVKLDKVTADRDQLHAISEMREAVFQQDERKLDAVRWCVKLSPTPIGCVSWSLENTR